MIVRMPRAPLSGAITLSVAAHVAAIAFWQTPQPTPTPKAHRALTVALKPGLVDSPAAAVAPQALPEVRGKPGPARVRPASRDAAPPGVMIGDAQPAPPEVVPPPAEGKVAGIAITTGGFGPFSGGMRRRAFYVPAADVAMQGQQGFATGRMTQAARASEEALVGRWIASLVDRLRDSPVRQGRCELRSGGDAAAQTCDASDAREVWTPVLEAPEAIALLERFGCVAFERADALASVGPCP